MRETSRNDSGQDTVFQILLCSFQWEHFLGIFPFPCSFCVTRNEQTRKSWRTRLSCGRLASFDEYSGVVVTRDLSACGMGPRSWLMY